MRRSTDLAVIYPLFPELEGRAEVLKTPRHALNGVVARVGPVVPRQTAEMSQSVFKCNIPGCVWVHQLPVFPKKVCELGVPAELRQTVGQCGLIATIRKVINEYAYGSGEEGLRS